MHNNVYLYKYLHALKQFIDQTVRRKKSTYMFIIMISILHLRFPLYSNLKSENDHNPPSPNLDSQIPNWSKSKTSFVTISLSCPGLARLAMQCKFPISCAGGQNCAMLSVRGGRIQQTRVQLCNVICEGREDTTD